MFWAVQCDKIEVLKLGKKHFCSISRFTENEHQVGKIEERNLLIVFD